MKRDQEINPAGVRGYLQSKFGNDLALARRVMQRLAKSLTPTELRERAFRLYEQFRPEIPDGVKGWRARGELDLPLIERLAKKKTS